MTLSKKQKRWLIIIGIIVGVALVFILAINLVLASIIEKKITQALKNHPEKNYHITLDRVGVNILTGNINLRRLKIEPDTAFVELLKKGQLYQKMVIRVDLPLFRLAGLNLYEAVADGDIDIRKLLFKNARVQVLVGKTMKQKPLPKDEEHKGFRLDSIRIEGLSGIQIRRIELQGFEIEFFDVVENKVISRNRAIDLDIKGIESKKLAGESNLFAFILTHASVELKNEEWELPGGLYRFTMKNMKLTLSDSTLAIQEFVLKPQIEDRFKMASKLKYTKGIFNVTVKEIKLSSIDFLRLVNHGELIVGQVQVSEMKMDIFKDKRKPWDIKDRPMYPNQALRTMGFPIYIGSVIMDNSYLKYHEESEKSFGNLRVVLDKMEVTVTHITSIKDSSRKPMNAHLSANLFKTAKMKVDFLMPLNSRVDTFFVSGTLGPSKMKTFNPALYPALGMKIMEGKLNSVVFKASANRNYIDGKMVMMYEGLETEVIKKTDKKVNKFVSWLANSVVRRSNPGKNDKLRTVPMHFDRDMYKGFINVVWKGVQTGLVNTVSPTGKTSKEGKIKGKPKGKTKHSNKELSKKEQRKMRREEKKEK